MDCAAESLEETTVADGAPAPEEEQPAEEQAPSEPLPSSADNEERLEQVNWVRRGSQRHTARVPVVAVNRRR
jgi:hypothetical protein